MDAIAGQAPESSIDFTNCSAFSVYGIQMQGFTHMYSALVSFYSLYTEFSIH